MDSDEFISCCVHPEATERRAQVDRASEQSHLSTTLMALEGMASYRRIEEAFHCKLRGPVIVEKKTLTELQNFQTVSIMKMHSLGNVVLVLIDEKLLKR